MDRLTEILNRYDFFMFDLYGTIIDIRTDEWADETWVKFLEYLDEINVKHPDLKTFRDDFFKFDRAYREKETPFDYPEIEILDVYEELFLKYNGKCPENLSEISYKFREVSRDYMRFMPGFPEFLSLLKKEKKKVFILSNAQASYTLPEIQFFELDKLMDDIIMSSDYRCMKPDIHFYNALIEKNHMDKSRTVMFGDSLENDVEGAKNAGISGIHVDEKDFYIKLMNL